MIFKRQTNLFVVVFLNCITNVLDQGGTVGKIYLAFAKAFNTVPHYKIINSCMHKQSVKQIELRGFNPYGELALLMLELRWYLICIIRCSLSVFNILLSSQK